MNPKAMTKVFLVGAALGAGAGALVGLMCASDREAGLRHAAQEDLRQRAGSALQRIRGARGRSQDFLQDTALVEEVERAMLPYAGSIL